MPLNSDKPTRPLTLEEAIALKARRMKAVYEHFQKQDKKRSASVIFFRPDA
ncbi:hypothetical protein J3D56_001019 [Erwinia persicina]|jgi:hypothetical protein|uniref:Uncharacterized protein n=2 Tax=Erwinia TaxID=551 RepID=A0ABV4E4E4_9GAMM|nr:MULTISPECIES: hypothetical protein [Erwinia]MCP1437583.1 hypothetical protein [Erwinia persicina]MDN4626495.1 hypothetical protein [Erwinia sp. PsM31]MDN8540949.1 hypothetical protein [Erwinia sp. BC051422]